MHRTTRFLLVLFVLSLARAPFRFLRHPRLALEEARTGLRWARLVVHVARHAKVRVP